MHGRPPRVDEQKYRNRLVVVCFWMIDLSDLKPSADEMPVYFGLISSCKIKFLLISLHEFLCKMAGRMFLSANIRCYIIRWWKISEPVPEATPSHDTTSTMLGLSPSMFWIMSRSFNCPHIGTTLVEVNLWLQNIICILNLWHLYISAHTAFFIWLTDCSF